MRKQLYFSIRVVKGTNTENAIEQVEDNNFDESHDLCDKVLTFKELEEEISKIKRSKQKHRNYMVYVSPAMQKKDKAINKRAIKNNYLAFEIDGKKLILLYTQKLARQKAKLFGGTMVELKTKPDPKKHYII